LIERKLTDHADGKKKNNGFDFQKAASTTRPKICPKETYRSTRFLKESKGKTLDSLRGSVGHACGHEFESRLK